MFLFKSGDRWKRNMVERKQEFKAALNIFDHINPNQADRSISLTY